MRRLSVLGVVSLLAFSLTSCKGALTGATTPPTLAEVQAHRAIWTAHAPPLYSYVLTENGGNTSFAGQPFQLVVRNDTVEGVTHFDTHQPVPGPYTFWPTIDGLFDEAASAASGGDLKAIAFDPILGYPTRMDFVPRPDVASSVEATDLAWNTPR
jgi:hypothetical protein